MTPRRVVIGIAAILTAAAPAIAEPAPDHRRVIGILDVRVDGVAPEVAATFQAKLEAQLDTGHYALVSHARVKQLMERSTKWTDGCVVGGCLHEVRTHAGAELVVIAALSGAGTTYGYVVTLVRTDTGAVVAQDSSRCDVCTATEAVDDATLATIKLVTSAPDTLPDEHALRAADVHNAITPLQAELATSARVHRSLGWKLAIAGLAVAAAGGAVYFAHDHDHTGFYVTSGGAGLAAGGVVVLSF